MVFRWVASLIMMTTFSVVIQAQSATVKSNAYDLMLQSLLSHSVPEVDIYDVMDAEEPVIFLDAREENEYEVSHIENAIHVGYDDFDISSVESLPKDTKVIVYCSVGYRSEKVAEQLIKEGFSDVANMYGGIFEWKNRNMPVYTSDHKLTDRVHAFDRTWGIWLSNGIKVYK